MKKSRIIIIVPAFNEAASIESVIRDLYGHGYRQLVVVDDGSSDSTADRAQKLGATVLRHIINRGLGAALGTGFAYARQHNFDLAVTFDADGQHQGSDIAAILQPLLMNRADVVVGSRFLWKKKHMPLGRLLENYISNLATFFLYGVWATDTLSGLRAFNQKAVKCIKIRTQRMEVSNEFFKEIKNNHLKYLEVPIKPIYTDYSSQSSSQGQFPQREIRLATAMILRLFR